MQTGRSGRRGKAGGFTYLGVLFLVALLGLALAGAGQIWSVSAQRAREAELLWVGNQYARALKSYFSRSPGQKAYPQKIEDLLVDRRFPLPVHHLRQAYRDPLNRDGEWGIVRNARGQIAGVYSQAPGTPLRRANFPAAWSEFEGAATYDQWRFIADPALRPAQAGIAASVVPAPQLPKK